MDLTILQNINFALVGGIIGILFTVKRLDTKGILGKKFYIVSVLVFGFCAGAFLVSEKFLWQPMITQGLIHAGVSSILYQTGKLFVPSEDGFFSKEKADEVKVVS